MFVAYDPHLPYLNISDTMSLWGSLVYDYQIVYGLIWGSFATTFEHNVFDTANYLTA